MTELALKVALAPALVVLATLVARRWGDTVGGIVIAVPVVAGPILLVLALEQGGAFVHEAAQAALLGIVAVGAFCVVCGRCLSRGWKLAIGAGWLGYAVATVALAQLEPRLWPALAAALIAIAVARGLVRAPPAEVVPRVDPPSWDLLARAGATVILVVALTSAASALGPAVSGLLTPFPVATSVVVAFTLTQGGPDAAARALRGYLTGLPGFTTFFVAVTLVT